MGHYGFSFAEVYEWLESTKAFGETDLVYEEWRTRKMRAQALKEKFALAQAKGQLIDAAEVEREWTSIVASLDAHMNRKAQHLAKKLLGAESPGEVRKMLNGMWRDVRKAVALGE